MRPKYYDEWVERYADSIIKQYILQIGDKLLKERETIIKKVREQLEDFMKDICILQSKADFSIGCIQGALLATSVINDKPSIIYEAFDQDQEYGHVYVAKEYEIDWLFTGWEELKESLQQSILENGYARLLSFEAVKSFMIEQIPSCAYVFTYFVKYIFKEMDSFKYFSDLKVGENFYISAGCYHDFYKILYKKQKNKDILISQNDRDFSFGQFSQYVYRKKKIVTGNFKSAVFSDCRFMDVNILGCDFSDCEFNNCSFTRVTINDSVFHGSIFRECTFSQVLFQKCISKKGLIIEKNCIKDICREAAFIQSEMKNVDFKECDMKDCRYIETKTDEDLEK